MSSSTDLAGGAFEALAVPELRTGSWTRYGGTGVLGDAVTEQALAGVAERAREAARAQGYAAGWAEGRRDAAAAAAVERVEASAQLAAERVRAEAELLAGVTALQHAAEGFRAATAAASAQLEDHALRLACEVAEAVVGHALRTSPEPAGGVARRALAVLPEGAAAVVRVHPSLVEAVVAAGELAPQVRVVADAGLAPDDAVVETDETEVDVRVSTALARVREALS